MISTAILALALSSNPHAWILLTDRSAMEVRSYAVDGALVHVTALDGSPLLLRTIQVDQPGSEKLTARKLAKATHDAAAKAQADTVAAEQADAAAEAKAAANVKQIARGGRAGSVSVIGRSGMLPSPSLGSSAPSAPSGGGDFGSLRSSYKNAKAELARLTAEHDAVAERHNASTNSAERRTMESQLGELRNKIAAKESEMGSLKAQYAAAEETARHAGVEASVYRAGIDG